MKYIRHELFDTYDKAVEAYREETKDKPYTDCEYFLDWFFEVVEMDNNEYYDKRLYCQEHPHQNRDRFSEGEHQFTGKEVLDVYMKEVIHNSDVKQPDKMWILAWLYSPVDEHGEKEIQQQLSGKHHLN